jgi:hypothetical protein
MIMKRRKKLTLLLATMLITMCICTACGKKNVMDTLNNIYDEGIERVQKAEAIEDVQKIYDEVTKQVNDFKTEHQKELSALDSSAITLQKAEETFVKACCIKLNRKGALLHTENGLSADIDENGNLYCPEDNAGDEGNYNSSIPNNPLNIIGYSYIYMNGNIEYITVMTPNGVYLYNEEDAEKYYDDYVSHFFFANMIARRVWYSDAQDGTKEYVKKHLFEIVSNLPLNINSYPRDVMDRVNKVYYDYMDKAKNLHLLRRDNGNSIYSYNGPTKLYVSRDPDHGGKLVICDLR